MDGIVSLLFYRGEKRTLPISAALQDRAAHRSPHADEIDCPASHARFQFDTHREPIDGGCRAFASVTVHCLHRRGRPPRGQALHGVRQAMPARICDGGFGGRKRKLDLCEGIIIPGPAHQRFDIRSRAPLETKSPTLRARSARSHGRRSSLVDRGLRIRRKYRPRQLGRADRPQSRSARTGEMFIEVSLEEGGRGITPSASSFFR